MSSLVWTRRANKAASGDLAVSIPPTRAICGRDFSFAVKTAFEMCDDQRDQIWRIFEENMYELYCGSSFGWNPLERKKEMFNPLSRFVIACDFADPGVTAYSIFRFEREDGQNVVYCYELQVSAQSRRFGLGKLLVQMLSDIGAQWGMTKVMLTVFKANHTAMLFYEAIGFTIDGSSPDMFEDSESEVEEVDYIILSRCIS